MPVSPQQKTLIQDSFHELQDRLQPVSESFYAALFRRDPALRTMFRDDLAGQGMKFMTTLGLVVENLDHPNRLNARFAKLGRGHTLIGVKPAHYDTMREALMDTLRAELGDGFSSETESAWRLAYADLVRQFDPGGAG